MVQNGGDFDLDTDMATDELDQRDKAAQARIKELENREKYSQKLVNEAYAKIEALEGAKAKRIKIEPPGKYRGTKEDLAVFRSYDRFEEELRKVFGDKDEKIHTQERLANLRQTKSVASYAEKVKDKLYKYDRPETLDEYIAQAIRIDNRLYTREQQKRGQINGTTVKANDKKKRAYVSTSYGTHPGAIDVDAAQKQD
ncbi:hypothetical protein MYCTH_2123530 [Thermothelomyces thermophilus ATCC 42464]|uniref:Retrotransposon gag domain-containing protein n=1 Tax=Thermothelomyces thermophilus (strain ATCC 42464 / BCRC 31852 / DSM 1799) TaxID=573729 RepID=G2Q5J4_THET4|nr:uncharacterized protein MYCTH_2123530 [Thermothelomyces thermophilus ATCC 42464]AEO54627.1 hypothetical protein MYCTH_2123530 [Thermothelomyces thermophilus ATCC 42464]